MALLYRAKFYHRFLNIYRKIEPLNADTQELQQKTSEQRVSPFIVPNYLIQGMETWIQIWMKFLQRRALEDG